MCVGRMKKNRLNRFFDRGDLTVAPRISPGFFTDDTLAQGLRAKPGSGCARKGRGSFYEKNQG